MTVTATAAGGSPYRVPITRLAAAHAALVAQDAAAEQCVEERDH